MVLKYYLKLMRNIDIFFLHNIQTIFMLNFMNLSLKTT